MRPSCGGTLVKDEGRRKRQGRRPQSEAYTTALLLFVLLVCQIGRWSCGGDELDSSMGVGLKPEASHVLGDLDASFVCPPAGCQAHAPPPGPQQSCGQVNIKLRLASAAETAVTFPIDDWCNTGGFREEEPPCLTKAEAGSLPRNPRGEEAVVIQPSYLDWGESALCSAMTHKFQIYNKAVQERLWITSVSTDEIQFYPLDFERLEVPPGGGATLSIVYLPRTLGPVDASLVVETSRGSFLVPMHGQGVPSPYGVTPLSGPKVPFGLYYSYMLMLRNPHEKPLRVKEVYTHNSFLQLRLPASPGATGALSTEGRDVPGPSHLWTIEPFAEKGVIMLEFKSLLPQKFSGMVTVITDEGPLLIPVDISAIKGGVHANMDGVDFGTLTFPEEHHSIPVALLNMGQEPVQLLDVFSSGSDPLLGIQFRKGLVLDPGVERTAATITYIGTAQGRFSGKLYFVTNETQVGNDPPTPGLPPHSVALPYKARVLHGSLRYRAENSTFEARKGRAVAREIHLTNHFSVPIVIYSATLADPSFELDYFPAGHVLAASGGAAPPVHLRFTPNSSDLSFTTHMLVSSNVSMLSIPLHVYHGRLHYSIPGPSGHSVHTLGSRQELGKNVLDFGVLGVNEARARSFNITNPNPIGIDISSIITSLPETNLRLDCVLDLLGMPVQLGTNQDKDSAPKQLTGNPAVAGGSTDDLGKETIIHKGGALVKGRIVHEPVVVEGGIGGGLGIELGPGHTAVFTVELSAGQEQRGSGEVVVVTSKERHSIPLLYESLVGSLSISPAIVRFEGCFPGLVRSSPLMARSTYTRSLTVTAVTTADPRIRLVLSNTTIPPNKRVFLGMLEFDAGADGKGMQLGFEEFNLNSAINAAVNGQLSKADQQEMKARKEAWEEVLMESGAEVRSTLTIHTDVVAGYSLSVRAGLSSPTILVAPSLNYSVVEVGKSALGVVQVVNPSSAPLAVALLEPVKADSFGGSGPGDAGAQPSSQTQSFLPCHSCDTDQGAGGTIKCKSCRLAYDAPKSTQSPRLPFRLPPGAVRSGLVQPGATMTLGPVEFSPQSHLEPSLALLHIRNNLTFVEDLELEGRGGSGTFQFLLDHDENHLMLRMDVDPSLLGLYDRTMGSWIPSSQGLVTRPGKPLVWPVTVHKKFTAFNTGNLPISVNEMWLLPAKASLGPYQPPGCRAGGFELRRCGADAKTKIPVSGHAEVWVAYSPDPSMILSQCLLLVETSIGRQHFHLSASTPHEALPPVHSMFSMSPELSKQRIWVILGTLVLALVALIVAFRELHEELMLSICALMATQGPAEKPQAGEAPCARVGDASVQQVVAVRQPAGLNSPGAAPIPHRAPSDSPGHPGEAPEAADDSQVDEVKGGRRRRRHKCPPDTGSTVAPCDGGSARDAPSSPRLQIDSIKHTGSTSSCGTGASTPVPMPSTPCPAVSDISSAQPPDTRGQILTGNESEASPTLCVSSPSEVPDAGAETCVEDSDEPLSPACRLRSGHLAWSPGSSKSGPSSRQIEETEPVQHVAPMPEAVTSLPGPSPPLAVRSSAQQSSQTGGGVEAPGSKRMAHAKLLTPLQTSEQPNLGVIMPASQHKQKLAHPHPSAPLLDTVPSPGMGHPEASPRDPGATPRSARRRRRPRRGGGSSSQPPTPGTGSLSAATTPAGADTGTGLLPADAPHSQRLPVGNTWSTLPPARPPSSRSNVHAHSPGIGYGQAMSNPAGSLDQLGAAVGVPDSLYSIWGSSSGRHASLLREPVAPPARNYCGNDSLGGSLFTSFPAGTNGDLLESRGWAPWGTMALDGQPAAMPLHAVLGEDLFVGSGLFPQSGGGLGSGGGGAFSGFSLFSPFLGGREMRGGAGDASYGDSGCATPFNTIWGQPSTGSSEFLWRQGSDDSNLRDPATSDENGAQGNPIW